MNDVPMAGKYDENGKYQKGIEDYVPNVQYQTSEHVNAVIDDMLDNWQRLSQGKNIMPFLLQVLSLKQLIITA